MYLAWFDDNPKKTVEQRIADARAAYAAKFGTPPTRVLVNERDANTPGVEASALVRPNTYYVG